MWLCIVIIQSFKCPLIRYLSKQPQCLHKIHQPLSQCKEGKWQWHHKYSGGTACFIIDVQFFDIRHIADGNFVFFLQFIFIQICCFGGRCEVDVESLFIWCCWSWTFNSLRWFRRCNWFWGRCEVDIQNSVVKGCCCWLWILYSLRWFRRRNFGCCCWMKIKVGVYALITSYGQQHKRIYVHVNIDHPLYTCLLSLLWVCWGHKYH